jgi:hypothetical protein
MVFCAIPGFVDEKWKFNELKQGLVEKKFALKPT